MLITSVVAAAAAVVPPAPPMMPREGAGGGTVLIFQLVLIFAVFYFVLIRPQRKQRQLHNQMLQQLVHGDRVMTNGGIVGEVVHAGESELTVRTAESTRIVVARSHIAHKIVEEEPDAQGAKGAQGAKRADKGKAAKGGGKKGPGLRGRGGRRG